MYPAAGLTCTAGSEEHSSETHTTVWRREQELERQQRKEKQQKEEPEARSIYEKEEFEGQHGKENLRRQKPCSLPSPPQKRMS